jgi:PDZ-binding kinase
MSDSIADSAPAMRTPPTPSHSGSPSKKSVRKRGGSLGPRGLLLPVMPNGAAQPPTPASAHGACLCTPADAHEHHTPPAELRRDSLLVPASDRLVRVARGSGVSVYRMDRSPLRGEPRSPWVIKKANISPLLVRERRRVERALEHESLMLSKMRHPNIVGFRAAQRVHDGQICLALEMCELSLYCLIQERASPDGGCVSPARSARAGAVMRPEEIRSVGREVAAGLDYLHREHQLLHGDIKSANILLSRDLSSVKICDLGVSLPLSHDLRELQNLGSQYEGTEPWRPPETLPRPDVDYSEPLEDDGKMRVCDRTDIFAFGLVLWEMLSGDVPHAAMLPLGQDAYRAVLGTRPPLPPLPSEYEPLVHSFVLCTQHEPDARPSASELVVLLAPSGAPDAEPDAPVVPTTTPTEEASHDDELVEDRSRRRASEPFAIRTAV